VKADPKIEAAVMNVINRYVESYIKRDADAVLALWVPDPDVVLIGTGVDERRIGLVDIKAQCERDFAQGTSIKISWHSVSAAGSVAWVAADLTARVKTSGREISLQGRLTSVLERRGDRWFIVQRHLSLPAAGQREGQSFQT